MDLKRGTSSPTHYRKQWRGGGGGGSGSSSPAHHYSTVKRTQKAAATAAAQRLAQVMAAQAKNESVGLDGQDDVNDDDDESKYGAASSVSSRVSSSNSSSNGLARIKVSTMAAKSPSPSLGRNFLESNPSVRSTLAGRPSISVRTGTMMPPSRPIRAPVSVPGIGPSLNWVRDKRFTSDIGQMESKDTNYQHEASALRDELDILQEENDTILEKVRRAEERREEAEARARELEKQVAALGKGVSMEAKLLRGKEDALRKREAALKAAEQSKDGKDEEILVLRSEIQRLKEEAVAAMEQVQDIELEAKSLCTMTERMVLTHEEMEEVVLKRCWLSRYWGLAVQHGICADIAGSKYEHWSSLAPLPLEVVISAGQKAKDESWNTVEGDSDAKNDGRNLGDLTGEGNIENMLSVEMALRELASLKVEHAVVLALAQRRSPNVTHLSISDSKVPGDQKFVEVFELSEAEAEDVIFKQAWLTYFWRRAKAHSVEEDIADERLQFWISQSGQSLTSHDAVDVERGILELRKLGIDQKLWEASRKELEQPLSSAISNHKSSSETESS